MSQQLFAGMIIPPTFRQVYLGGHHAVLCDAYVHLQVYGEGVGSSSMNEPPGNAVQVHDCLVIDRIYPCDCSHWRQKDLQ